MSDLLRPLPFATRGISQYYPDPVKAFLCKERENLNNARDYGATTVYCTTIQKGQKNYSATFHTGGAYQNKLIMEQTAFPQVGGGKGIMGSGMTLGGLLTVSPSNLFENIVFSRTLEDGLCAVKSTLVNGEYVKVEDVTDEWVPFLEQCFSHDKFYEKLFAKMNVGYICLTTRTDSKKRKIAFQSHSILSGLTHFAPTLPEYLDIRYIDNEIIRDSGSDVKRNEERQLWSVCSLREYRDSFLPEENTFDLKFANARVRNYDGSQVFFKGRIVNELYPGLRHKEQNLVRVRGDADKVGKAKWGAFRPNESVHVHIQVDSDKKKYRRLVEEPVYSANRVTQMARILGVPAYDNQIELREAGDLEELGFGHLAEEHVTRSPFIQSRLYVEEIESFVDPSGEEKALTESEKRIALGKIDEFFTCFQDAGRMNSVYDAACYAAKDNPANEKEIARFEAMCRKYYPCSTDQFARMPVDRRNSKALEVNFYPGKSNTRLVKAEPGKSYQGQFRTNENEPRQLTADDDLKLDSRRGHFATWKGPVNGWELSSNKLTILKNDEWVECSPEEYIAAQQNESLPLMVAKGTLNGEPCELNLIWDTPGHNQKRTRGPSKPEGGKSGGFNDGLSNSMFRLQGHRDLIFQYNPRTGELLGNRNNRNLSILFRANPAFWDRQVKFWTQAEEKACVAHRTTIRHLRNEFDASNPEEAKRLEAIYGDAETFILNKLLEPMFDSPSIVRWLAEAEQALDPSELAEIEANSNKLVLRAAS